MCTYYNYVHAKHIGPSYHIRLRNITSVFTFSNLLPCAIGIRFLQIGFSTPIGRVAHPKLRTRRHHHSDYGTRIQEHDNALSRVTSISVAPPPILRLVMTGPCRMASCPIKATCRHGTNLTPPSSRSTALEHYSFFGCLDQN
jgi:hypothetical protein